MVVVCNVEGNMKENGGGRKGGMFARFAGQRECHRPPSPPPYSLRQGRRAYRDGASAWGARFVLVRVVAGHHKHALPTVILLGGGGRDHIQYTLNNIQSI
jgi:hypothetical protein